MNRIEISRRQFLKTTGGLIVSFNLLPTLPASSQSTTGPGIDADPTQLDSWLAIAPDGTVTVFSGKVDLGTGVESCTGADRRRGVGRAIQPHSYDRLGYQ